MPALAGDDRAEIRRIDRRGRARAGQGNRAGLAMSVVKVHVASDQRKLVRTRRQPGQQLGESNAGRAGGDRRKRPAIFDRRLGLGIEEIEVARPAAEPDQQNRFGFGGFGCFATRLTRHAASAKGAAAPAQRKRPAAHALAGLRPKASDFEQPHGSTWEYIGSGGFRMIRYHIPPLNGETREKWTSESGG